jgi:putative Flp pilus-assembly TadE/G-like protein
MLAVLADGHSAQRSERGQTIVLVAISLFALLAMAALAIDVTTLYVNRNQAEQAVDAAALAGAKAFVSSGFTSGNVSSNTAQTLATNEALSAGQQSVVAGAQVTAAELTVTFPQMTQSNPVISVAFSRTGIPSFFARIWGVRGTSVGATAKAEAYNPSGSTSATPIQVAGAKPWLLPNCNPFDTTTLPNPNCAGYSYFLSPTDGTIVNASSFIGGTITLQLPNTGGPLTVTAPPNPSMQYYPLDIPENPPTPFCPSSAQVSCGNTPGFYYDSIACFNPTRLTCGESINGPADPLYVDARRNNPFGGNLKNRTDEGTQCLIHAGASDFGQGQDSFVTGPPILIQPGVNNPNASLAGADYISRSDSVVTVALFDGSNLCAGGNCSQVVNTTVVGFLQLGIQASSVGGSANSGSLQAIIMNASGCNPNPTGAPISGGDVSPIPFAWYKDPKLQCCCKIAISLKTRPNS